MSSRTLLILVFACIMTFMFAFFISNRIFKADGAGWKQIVTSDGRGYYAYLPAFLIDRDVTFSKVVQKEKRLVGYPDYKPGYLVGEGNRTVNKYFAGEALLLLPFFLIAILLSWFTSTPLDGYSFFFQILAGTGALIYLFLGLHFLKKILLRFNLQPMLVAIILTVILFGTNLFYYSMWQPTMSHLYSFFAINGFLWSILEFSEHPDPRRSLLAGLFLGLVILIRPTNAIVILLVPFVILETDKLKNGYRFVLQKKVTLLFFLLAVLIILIIQPILWHLQTGRWLIWSYRNEGFHFGKPELINVLFSYRKGLFIYTPLILLSLIGMITLWRQPVRIISMVLFLLISTWVIASWWNWYYGDSFGLRAFIDYYGIYAILLGLAVSPLLPLSRRMPGRGSGVGLSGIYPNLRIFFIILLFLPFVFLNLFQTWQYNNSIIHPYSMNREKFRYVFLESDSAYVNCLGSNDELPDYTIDMARPILQIRSNLEKPQVHMNMVNILKTSRAFSGSFAACLDSIHTFSPGLDMPAGRICKVPVSLYLKGSVMVYDSVKYASNKAVVVFSMDSINFRENYWFGFPLNDIPENPPRKWRECNFNLNLPKILNPDKKLKIYIWNTGKKPFLIDDMQFTFYGVKKRSDRLW